MLDPKNLKPGQEQFEEYIPAGKKFMLENKVVQYDYRHTDGNLFSTVAKSLAEARERRDSWILAPRGEMTTETYAEQRAREFNTITPGPWRWKFLGNAGNYYLVGNDGEGPIVNSGPNSADGKLMQAAPALVAALRAAADDLQMASALLDNHNLHELADRIFARYEAARAALAGDASEGGAE